MNDGALLSLFQLTDTLFPSGLYAYSFGLETYVSKGTISNSTGFNIFLKNLIAGSIKHCDALILKLCMEAINKSDLEAVIYYDKIIHSMKVVREFREGDIQMGRQLLKIMRQLYSSEFTNRYSQKIENNTIYGHHIVVYALACNVLGIDIYSAILAYLYNIVSGIVGAGLRLIPLGQTEGQKTIDTFKGFLSTSVSEIMNYGEQDIYTFTPGIEIMGMKHETLYTRLFRS
ncbi:MAG: urease accessory protein UreF [Candidatus Acididesulfobacter diazotrophicus]|uniref:Urease accessory protein UreF n=1 Tax=Candidatus Acididesulfobacter diazotrophicus TaxID=2597226 RepID=A0A519BMN3_9DELT|nr:MAG: urease accessory protein UreF [Candidatus Acididesulfobacter diazotrophicus]